MRSLPTVRPVYERAAAAHPDIVFAKVDTEAERSLAAAANITAIPTLMVFRNRVLVFSQPGALPPAALDQVISSVRSLPADVRQGGPKPRPAGKP